MDKGEHVIKSAIKCDVCRTIEEMDKGQLTGHIKIPEGWVQIKSHVYISGSKSKDEGARDSFVKRRDKLKALVKPMHVCPDCTEEMVTGRKSIKITDRRHEEPIQKNNP